ncbi:MAG: hypothetical protein U0586_12985 [Candidatus Brocadiaceae bacterium]
MELKDLIKKPRKEEYAVLEVRINVSEIKEVIKEIAEAPGKIFTMMRYNVRESAERYLSHLMDSELIFYLGRERYV